MAKTLELFVISAALFLCFTNIVLCDDDQLEVVKRDAFSFTIPNPVGDTPLFQTNDQGGRYFGLHVPMIYDGVLHFRGPGMMGTRFSFDWFHGLFAFNYDKTPQADGLLHGPVYLEMLWMKVYNNHE